MAAVITKRKPRARRSLADRLWGKTEKGGPDECWIWGGYVDIKGYGMIYRGPTPSCAKTHRVSWELANGPIPAGLSVCHHCDAPGCINPAHLFLGTNRDNQQDAKQKGRRSSRQGEANGQSRLTEQEVLVILELDRPRSPEMSRRLAERFGVTRGTIEDIWHGRAWAHLPPKRLAAEGDSREEQSNE